MSESDSPLRELLRAAQTAELQGNKTLAIDLLLRAAQLYEQSGHFGRAVQMLRHACRLEPEREDLMDEQRRMEREASEVTQRVEVFSTTAAAAVLPVSVAVEEAAKEALEAMDSASTEEPSEVLDEVSAERLRERAARAAESRRPRTVNLKMWLGDEGDPERPAELSPEPVTDPQGAVVVVASEVDVPAEPEPFVQRGPTQALPGQDAWCSFCCRPKTEVGELVSGPTGSFICRSCVEQSVGLYGLTSVPVSPVALVAPQVRHTLPVFVGQTEGVRAVEQALASGKRFILLLGPPGCGKTAYLQQLVRRGLGGFETNGAGAWLVEDPQPLQGNSSTAAAVVLSMQGKAPVPLVSLRGDDSGSMGLYESESLVRATEGRLSLQLAEQVDAVALFAPLGEEALATLAQQHLTQRSTSLSVPSEVVDKIVRRAIASGRGAHELLALLSRIPDGSWTVQAQGRPAKATKAAKASKPAKSVRKAAKGKRRR